MVIQRDCVEFDIKPSKDNSIFIIINDVVVCRKNSNQIFNIKHLWNNRRPHIFVKCLALDYAICRFIFYVYINRQNDCRTSYFKSFSY